MYKFSFERLDVWIKSRYLTKRIYQLSLNFPDYEKFGLGGQIRRAIISVCSNIAEGSSRKSRKDQSHFYSIAFSSLMETLNQIILAHDLGYVDDNSIAVVRNEIQTISNLLNALNNSTKRKGR